MSIELKRGWWQADDGSRWFVIGRDAKGFWVADSEARNGHTWFDDEGRIKRCLDGMNMRAQLARFLEGCTSFDWRERKSLGELLWNSFGNKHWERNSYTSHKTWDAAAESFLRDVLQPQSGSLADAWAKAIFHGHSDKDRAQLFLAELTGLDFSAEATP